MSHVTYYIIYPAGDRTRISLLDLSSEMSYELSDYAVASRRQFYDFDEADAYAQDLAKKHKLSYRRVDQNGRSVPDYLD